MLRGDGMTGRPALVAVSGPPGAGKTTLARAVAEALAWPLVCRDEIRERLAVTGSDSTDPNLKTLELFFREIGELLTAGKSVVAEAAFQDRLWRPGLEPLTGLAGIRVVRSVVDPEIARARISRRAVDDPSRAVHADAELLRRIADGQRPIESWVPIALDVPSLVVDTTRGYRPSLGRVVEFGAGVSGRRTLCLGSSVSWVVMSLSDYLDITVAEAERQWREILSRQGDSENRPRINHTPVETLLAGAVRVVANVRAGGGDGRTFPFPVPELARLFRRKPNGVASKVQNLSGVPGRNRGATTDIELGRRLAAEPKLVATTYRVVVTAARNVGIGTDRLSDFLGLEHGGSMVLLGQEEIDEADLQTAVEREMRQRLMENLETDGATERALMRMIRVGQSAFASEVLRNYGDACAFCGFTLGDGRRPTLLRAGHIKPWRDSNPRERLDVANGIAACPTHDAAFDTGLMTLDTAANHLVVRFSPRLAAAVNNHPATAFQFTGDGLRQRIDLTVPVVAPEDRYLAWHREQVFG
ncbi:AAA family ATPase [Myceligenerans indicum]|uniref:AAA family ATPase n=1 Tax=Myceligenerans indicum TaxID=2593663 RepID=A0ABS1LJH9_9MICO|nr:AAA family ATPase [Myceligenerans indicum]MBL0886395.1 AAA family ATPase [Myceligenerans indicum]